jgi:methylase of polypeptide subunit release factors
MPPESPRAYDPNPVKSLLERHAAYAYPRSISFAGIDLVLEKDVFAPDLTKTSILMVNCLATLPFGAQLKVLDAFTGCGIFAIYCASRGCSVIAVDHSPQATRCATANAKRNGVEDNMDVRLGSGLSVLQPSERFDLIIATPPLLPGTPTNTLETAVFDPGLATTLSFIQNVPKHLKATGTVMLMLSDVFQRVGNNIYTLATDSGVTAHEISRHDVGYEKYSIFSLRNVTN